ncbi:MAG TPA: sugar phosphate isomerase/epimerase family protein [Tepidisphaeraceae bacterium]|jgi:sugar phosphate isomerase/epimerase
MNLGGHDIGVCSWSLRSESADALVEMLGAVGLSHVQLDLRPMIDDETAAAAVVETLTDAEVEFTAGMIGFPGENYATIGAIHLTGGLVPDDAWPERRVRTLAAAKLAADIGLPAVTLHVGFIPSSNDPAYKRILDRVADAGAEYARLGVDLLIETGQEKAPELLRFLNDLNAPNVGVNFDPANMLLYGAGDPIEAVQTLGRHIRHVHLKDATLSGRPGVEWGKEKPFGRGGLDVVRFFRGLEDVAYAGPYVIERESGEDVLADLQDTIVRLQEILE